MRPEWELCRSPGSAPSLMSGAMRLLKLKVPVTLVAHSRLYSSSVSSVVITCNRPNRA